MNIIARQLGVVLDGHHILQDLHFTLSEGLTGVIGPNGAGKSTLVQSLAGILPHSGHLEFCAEGMERSTRQPRGLSTSKLGYLPQTPLPESGLTVLEAVLLGLVGELGLRVTAEQLERVDAQLAVLEIKQLAERRLSTLSGGQRQLVALAQCLVRDPKLLLLDEPLNNLDLHHQLEILDIVQAWTRQTRASTLAVLHDLSLAARYCDRLLLISQGKLKAFGLPEEVLTPSRLREEFYLEGALVRDRKGRLHLEGCDLYRPVSMAA